MPNGTDEFLIAVWRRGGLSKPLFSEKRRASKFLESEAARYERERKSEKDSPPPVTIYCRCQEVLLAPDRCPSRENFKVSETVNIASSESSTEGGACSTPTHAHTKVAEKVRELSQTLETDSVRETLFFFLLFVCCCCCLKRGS